MPLLPGVDIVKPDPAIPPDFADLRRSGLPALFVDFDGTLVEIADRPDAISVPSDLAARLLALSDRIDGRVALVSGRALGDIESYTGALSIARAGSHGGARLLASGVPLGDAAGVLPAQVVAAIRSFAQKHAFALEEKPHGAALHYRAAPDLAQLGHDFADELALAHGLQVKRGKFVIELVLPGADKGAAVRAFMAVAPFAGGLPIFIGDDVTDEDGFAAAEQLGGFGIRVGDPAPTRARYRLSDPAAVHAWLGL